MYRKYVLFLFIFSIVIPQLDFHIWADMFPELKQILLCESNLNPNAYNYDKGAHARGIAQITRKYHPEVSDVQAYNPAWSLWWAINVWYAGNTKKEWSCYEIVNKQIKLPFFVKL